MTLTYLKENFQNQDLEVFFFLDTSVLRAPIVAFRFAANLSIASYRVCLHTGNFYRKTYRFQDIGVQRSPLIMGALHKFAIFRLTLQRQIVRYRLPIWQIGRPSGAVASQ